MSASAHTRSILDFNYFLYKIRSTPYFSSSLLVTLDFAVLNLFRRNQMQRSQVVGNIDHSISFAALSLIDRRLRWSGAANVQCHLFVPDFVVIGLYLWT